MGQRPVITRLRDIDSRAGTLTFPRDTPLMHNFTPGHARQRDSNTNHEAHEQFVVHRYLRPDDSVIELGEHRHQLDPDQPDARWGANGQHYVFEPQAELAT